MKPAGANGPLAGVRVFVDVRTDEGIDTSEAIAEMLTDLGAR